MMCACTRHLLAKNSVTISILPAVVNNGPLASFSNLSQNPSKGHSESSWLFTYSSIQDPSHHHPHLHHYLQNGIRQQRDPNGVTRLHTSPSISESFSKEVQKYVQKPTWSEWFRQKMGRGRVSKGQLLRSAYGLTSVATHKVDIVAWFRAMEMPDTFYSWWLITELHIWMLCTRVKVPKSPEGDYLMEHMINGLYEDLEKRMKQVPGMTASKRSDQIWDLAEEFQTAIILYDYGQLKDDAALANALWKRFFLADEDVSPKLVENLVKYVRKTMAMLDEVAMEEMLYGDAGQDKLKWFDIEKVVKE